MGQPLNACCHPTITTSSNEVEISPLHRQLFNPPPKSQPDKEQPTLTLKPIDSAIAETLQTAIKFRKHTEISNQTDSIWSIQVKGEDSTIQHIFCRAMEKKQLEGQVTLYFPKGQLFQGKILNKQPIEGAFIFKKSCFYVGDISQYNAQGYGRYENQDTGYIYEGTWSKGLPHGKGKELYKNGDSYEGEIMYGQKFGHGIYRFADRKVYDGSFYYNQSDGKGTMTYPNDSRYEGQWKLGKFHGKGTFFWPNRQSYQGEYAEGLRHGKGKYMFKNGSWYEGGWQYGLQSGRGCYHQGYDDIEGEWKEGDLIN